MNNEQAVDMVLINGVWVVGKLTNYSYEQALGMAAGKKGGLPEDFDQWDLSNDEGWTIAHEAASYHRLPANFNQWGLADKEGWTVAHTASDGCLPEDFSQWDLANSKGWTVAHVAAARQLPPNFTQWGLADKDGWTVAHEFADHTGIPPVVYWGDRDCQGLTVAEVVFAAVDEDYIKEKTSAQITDSMGELKESVLKSIKEVDPEWYHAMAIASSMRNEHNAILLL
jgi:hypothetical protein